MNGSDFDHDRLVSIKIYDFYIDLKCHDSNINVVLFQLIN